MLRIRVLNQKTKINFLRICFWLPEKQFCYSFCYHLQKDFFTLFSYNLQYALNNIRKHTVVLSFLVRTHLYQVSASMQIQHCSDSCNVVLIETNEHKKSDSGILELLQ